MDFTSKEEITLQSQTDFVINFSELLAENIPSALASFTSLATVCFCRVPVELRPLLLKTLNSLLEASLNERFEDLLDVNCFLSGKIQQIKIEKNQNHQ